MGKSGMKFEDLALIFKDGAPVRGCPTGILNGHGVMIGNKPGEIIGRGFFEADLISMGLEKRTLKKLVDERMLEKVTVKHKGSWRNTYVLKCEVKLDA